MANIEDKIYKIPIDPKGKQILVIKLDDSEYDAPGMDAAIRETSTILHGFMHSDQPVLALFVTAKTMVELIKVEDNHEK